MQIQKIDKQCAIHRINQLASQKTPFLFIASFDTSQNIVIPLSEIDPLEIAYDFQGITNNVEAFMARYFLNEDQENGPYTAVPAKWLKSPIDFETYNDAFQQLITHLKMGEIKLANLTFPTEVKCNLTLPEIFSRTKAKYRIFLKDHFCSFSPETFITINKGIIATYPMKGTINAGIFNAKEQLLNDPKEIDEHKTVSKEAVRDIEKVASNAHISRFRYVDKIHRGEGAILQTSSVIEGTLPDNFLESLGDIIYQLLPAGSITGSPKERAIEILANIESYDRSFYSGVAGIFDGENLDSSVLIRYLEQSKQKETATDINPSIQTDLTARELVTMKPLTEDEILFRYTFKSGGGITAMSNAKSEYDELIEKIYLPIS